MRLQPFVLSTLLLIGLSGAVLAQTDDHEDEDRAYQQRLSKSHEGPMTREAIIATADKLIRDGKDYTSKTTAHWQVRTDDASVDVATYAAFLESFRTWFDSFWKGRLEVGPSDDLGRIYIFGSFHDYNVLLTGGALHGAFRPAGHYSLITDVVALNLGSIDPKYLTDTLVHEVAHMLVAREILRGRATAPWLAEGLAEYFECTARNDTTGFQTGAVGGHAKRYLQSVKPLFDAKPAWSVDALMRPDDPTSFYDTGAQARYGASWLLVHTLFHAESGKYAAAFAKFISETAVSGVPDPDRLYELTGLDATKLTTLIEAHSRDLDVR